MADQNTIDRAMSGLGSTMVRAGALLRKARTDFGRAHEPRQRLLTAVIACLLCCAALSLLLAPIGDVPALEYVEAPLKSSRVKMLEDPALRDPDILVIAIDEAALAYGDASAAGSSTPAQRYAWPWPRHVYNKLIRWCRQGGARVIAFDFVFSESGPNTNDPVTRVPNDAGGMLNVWTADKAGDDLFVLEATAHPDVCLAVAMDSRPRPLEARDTLLQAYAARLEGPGAQAARQALVADLAGMQSLATPLAGLLNGRPGSALMNDLDKYKPEQQRQEIEAYYRVLAQQSPSFQSPRFGSLLPLPAPAMTGAAGAGIVFAQPDEVDGTLRQGLTVATFGGQVWRHFALETWRLYVLSFARQATDEAAREAFARRFAGLELKAGNVQWDGAEYALADGLKTAPVKLQDGRMRYLGIDVAVDDAARFDLRYRGLLPMDQDPVYVHGNADAREKVRQVYERGQPVALYPTVSAADVLRDWDVYDLSHGGWQRRLDDLKRQLKETQEEIDDFGEEEGGPLHAKAKTLRELVQAFPAEPPGGFGALRLGEPSALVKDKVVMIAGSAAGLGDLHHTPLSRSTPGTYYVANTFDNLKNSDVMRRLPTAVAWLLAFGAGVLATLLVMFAGRLRNGLLLTLALGAAMLVASGLFFRGQVWFPTAAPLAGLLLGFSHGALAKALTEGRQRRQREAFARQYMGKELVDYVIKNPGSLKLGGENRPMTIFFSDVAGFTTVTETLGPNNPERLVELLNVYLERMTDLMLETGGVIDKYIGDAIMCFWGAPMKMDDHAVRAIRGALKCRAELRRMQPLFADAVRKVAPQLIKPDGTVLHARAGINSGIVTVGNMGSSKRFAYTVMGDAVNLAARLEGQNKEYGTDILIGPKTAEIIKGDFTLRRIDLIVVKGKTEPTQVFEVMGERDVPQFITDLVAVYETGIDLFRDRQFEAALREFQSAAKQEPAAETGDTPSHVYIERCEYFIANPPAPGWDGVYVKKTK